MKWNLGVAIRIAVFCALAVGLWLFMSQNDWSGLSRAMHDAAVWPLVVAAGLGFAMLWCKAFSLRMILAPRHRVSTARVFQYTIVASAVSVIVPFRAGELVRLWLLKQRDGVPVEDSAAAVVGHAFLDGVAMLMFVAPLPFLLPDAASWVGQWLVLGAVIAIAVLVALYLAVGSRPAAANQSWLDRAIAGMHVVRDPRRLVVVLGGLLASRAVDLVIVSLALYAVGIDLPIAAGLLILFSVNLSILFQMPANVSSIEVGALAAATQLHVPQERALAFALLYLAVQVLPLLVVGFVLEMQLLLGRLGGVGHGGDDRGVDPLHVDATRNHGEEAVR